MIVLSHRGFWRALDEKNSLVAFDRTIQERFGTETDVRDYVGELVVSHDPASGRPIAWNEVLNRFEATGLPLAVNVKADGLSPLLAAAFSGKGIDWFAFDMSGPETVRYAAEKLPFFTRHSDVETMPVLYEEAQGVWLDAFCGDWFDAKVVTDHLQRGKRVCVVSPELHGRDYDAVWTLLKPLNGGDKLMICTDLPDKARAFFAS